jgi:hypothetical protein
MTCDDWAVYNELFMYLCYFDMLYIQWHHLAKKDVWNKAHMNMNISMKYNMDNILRLFNMYKLTDVI